MKLDLDLDKIQGLKYFGTSGSGNQRKAWVTINNQDYLIKLNSKYREASKEQSVSRLLIKLGIDHVNYEEKQNRIIIKPLEIL